MDNTNNNDIDDAYQSIFVESRLFKSQHAVSSMTLSDVADHTFVSFIVLWIMYNVHLTKTTAMAYADRTMSFSNFTKERSMATDLYICMNLLTEPDTKFEKQLAEPTINAAAKKHIKINVQAVKAFLDDMSMGRLDLQDAKRFLFRLERMLNIRNVMYKNFRRMSGDWSALSPTEKNMLVTRLNQYYNLHAKRSELKLFLDDLASAEGYTGAAPAKTKGAQDSTLKNLAVAVGALYGGYRLGKALIPVEKLVKK